MMMSNSKHANHTKILLYASDLAAAIGRHKYCTSDEVKARMLKRLRPEQFAMAKQRLQARSKHKHAGASAAEVVALAQLDSSTKKAVASCTEDQASLQVEAILSTPSKTVTKETTSALQSQIALISQKVQDPEQASGAADSIVSVLLSTARVPDSDFVTDIKESVQAQQEAAAAVLAQQTIHGSVPSQDQLQEFLQLVKLGDSAQVSSAVQKVVNCNRGIDNENRAINMYQDQQGVRVVESNQVFYKQPLGSLGGHQLGGRVDGFAMDASGTSKDRVVEVKNRRNRFFAILPDYEYVQVQAYMFLTKLTKCDVVQCRDNLIRITSYNFSPNDWEEIAKAAGEFAEEVKLLLDDHQAQDNLMTWLHQHNKFCN